MSNLENLESKISDIDKRLDRHEGKVESALDNIADSLQKISEVMFKQEQQGEIQKEQHNDIKALQQQSTELDKASALAIQREESMDKSATEIKSALKSTIRWGFGIFASLIIVLVGAAFKAFQGGA